MPAAAVSPTREDLARSPFIAQKYRRVINTGWIRQYIPSFFAPRSRPHLALFLRLGDFVLALFPRLFFGGLLTFLYGT